MEFRDEYENGFFDYLDVPFPKKEDFILKSSCGECKNLHFDENRYKAAMLAYKKASREKHDHIKNVIFFETGFSNHPAREIIWNRAWEEAHSEGYVAVYDAFVDLVDFVMSVNNAKNS